MEYLEKIRSILEEIVYDRFGHGPKIDVRQTNYSLQFACPYCGDSLKSERKKRAHIFTDDYSFHCFNCSTHKSLFNFLNEFNKINRFSLTELDDLGNCINEHAKDYAKIRTSVPIDIFFNTSVIESFAISRKDFKKHYSLNEVKGTVAEKYLLERGQQVYEKYLYSDKANQIWILNLTRGGKIIGAQTRALYRTENRYYTYSLKKIYSDMSLEWQAECDDMEKLSLIFNIFCVDFNKPIKVLEGAFDANLIGNAVSKTGADKHLPFTLDDMIYIYDYDKKGREKAMEAINSGFKVFLWDKFLNDHKDLCLNINNKIDITDVVKSARKTGTSIKSLSNYYSEDKYDLYYV